MASPSIYTYSSPLEGYQDAPPLTDEKVDDGKSYLNPQTNVLSHAYSRFTNPIDNGTRGGFDIHIYFYQNNPTQSLYARELHARIRHEFPELRIYKIWNQPIGPHTIGMFEVNIFSPAQFGAFVSWLVVWRGDLSVLVHPNTEDEERDHTQRAVWMGERVPLDLSVFTEMRRARERLEGATVG